jgi:ATP-dependent Lon protease
VNNSDSLQTPDSSIRTPIDLSELASPQGQGSKGSSSQTSHSPLLATIIQATSKRIYDINDVHTAAQKVADQGHDGNRSLMSLYSRMIDAGPDRFSVKPSGMPDFMGLYETLPNFAEVLDDIKRAIALCVDSPDSMEIQPILLSGPPGVGKTHFAQAISHLLGTGFHMISMASTTAGFVLGGSSSQWKNSKPGKIFEAYMSDRYANPVFLIDEIDKAGGSREYDPLGALYTLLEPGTAKSFVDEFVEVPIDTRGAIWIATCNDERSIPSPILHRLNVHEIKTPDMEQAARIALIIYQELRNAHMWGARFPDHPGEEVLGAFAQITPRQMRREIMTAFGNAKLAKRDAIKCDDLMQKGSSKTQSIGFLQ